MKDFLIVKPDVFWLGLVASQGKLVRVCLSYSEESTRENLGIKRSEKASTSSLLQSLRWDLADYWKGKRVDFSKYSLELASYSSFSKKVWAQTRLIPYGEVRSYKWVAERIGSKGFQAVGKALGNNPFPIIVPCHRVIKEDGELGGFSSGLGIKRKLLKIEGFLND
ncbi:methylated-DNA--[protein]-cysteine S-methyltransferase [Candidatus Aerophobetes bacterium]|uniref:methylated-DNA--[protein]-cysteine S-methyltransferase n=1 Tax=Aerophobetes bacterium TaxID=2030807 RepID=A0A523TF33_UNCAE|nr:MAG: methylated-DNA--[protein]-cysteine S-methyltransferase [Candidatus Aerophobetes bacterium]